MDARVSDLTDRLSAELQTLATRLPESAAEITRAAGVLRQRLDAAVRGLEQAVKTLDVSTAQSLAARLEQYDKLVAQAVDHFSGTLLTWDSKLSELTDVGRTWGTTITDFQREASVTLKNAHASAETAALAATAVAKAAEVVNATVGQQSTTSKGVSGPPAGTMAIPNGSVATERTTQGPT
jgi:hypothetical protein